MKGLSDNFMYINLCPNTIGINSSSFSDIVTLASKHGFEGIDFSPNYFESVEQAAEAGEFLKSLNLKWGLFYLPCDFLCAGDTEFKKGMDSLKQMLPRVKAAGCHRTYSHIWPGSDSRHFSDNFKWHVHRLKALIDILCEYDVHLGVEFIGPKTLRDSFQYPFIYNLPQTMELADAVSPELGLVIDCFHFYTSGGKLNDLKAIPSGDKIVNVHVNDAVYGRSRDQQLDNEREMPMTSGLVDAPGVLLALQELKYQGPVICEPFQPHLNRLRNLPMEDVALEVSDCMKKLFKKINK